MAYSDYCEEQSHLHWSICVPEGHTLHDSLGAKICPMMEGWSLVTKGLGVRCPCLTRVSVSAASDASPSVPELPALKQPVLQTSQTPQASGLIPVSSLPTGCQFGLWQTAHRSLFPFPHLLGEVTSLPPRTLCVRLLQVKGRSVHLPKDRFLENKVCALVLGMCRRMTCNACSVNGF